MINKVDHIAIIVKDLDKAVKVYAEGLGLEAKWIEQSDAFQVKMAFIPVGEVFVELIEPIGLGRARDFLKEHGQGLYHIAYQVDDIEKAIEAIGAKLMLKDKSPRPGGGSSRVAFLDPGGVFNVRTEIVERDGNI